MNNNLYHWHDERMVDLEMREIRRELADANLFTEARFSGVNWLARAVSALLSLLTPRGRDLRDHHPVERRSY